MNGEREGSGTKSNKEKDITTLISGRNVCKKDEKGREVGEESQLNVHTHTHT